MKVLSAVRLGQDPRQTDNLTKNHIYLILGTLMHRGFVTQTRIDGDRRRKLYTITATGKAILRLSITTYQNLIHQVNF